MPSDTGVELLRRIAIGDPPLMAVLLGGAGDELVASPPTWGLARLSVVIARCAGPAAIVREVGSALSRGCTADEIIGVLPAVAPLVGSVAVMIAAPAVAAALGFDLDAALFGSLEPPSEGDLQSSERPAG